MKPFVAVFALGFAALIVQGALALMIPFAVAFVLRDRSQRRGWSRAPS
jgi:hypothetical protein